MKIAIIGAGELGKLITQHAVSDSGYEVVGYYDDYVQQTSFNDRPILGNTSQIQQDFENSVFDRLIVGIGYRHMKVRSEIYNKFKGSIPFANVIHSSCYIDKSSKVGEGNFFLPGVVVDCGVTIHDNVLFNTATVIAHDTEIMSHSFIAPGVTIAGLVRVGECCFIGIGAIIRDCITIAPYSTIGAGAVVVKDTLSNTISTGIPARVVNK